MADTPPAPRFPIIRQYALAALAAAVSALAARYLPEPRTVEKPVPAPAPLAVPSPLVNYEGHRYDGSEDHDHFLPLAGGEPQSARWPTDRITYGIDYPTARGINPPLSDEAVRAAFRQATGWWSEQLEIDFVEVAYSASPMIPIRFEPIDRPGGVLAQAYLADGTVRPKPLVMDVTEYWTAGAPADGRISIPTVACHELGHSLGKGHDAANAPAVMRPTYSASIPREQERDIQGMVALGYKRRAKVPPAAQDVLRIEVQIKTDDAAAALRGLGYSVTK